MRLGVSGRECQLSESAAGCASVGSAATGCASPPERRSSGPSIAKSTAAESAKQAQIKATRRGWVSVTKNDDSSGPRLCPAVGQPEPAWPPCLWGRRSWPSAHGKAWRKARAGRTQTKVRRIPSAKAPRRSTGRALPSLAWRPTVSRRCSSGPIFSTRSTIRRWDNRQTRRSPATEARITTPRFTQNLTPDARFFQLSLKYTF